MPGAALPMGAGRASPAGTVQAAGHRRPSCRETLCPAEPRPEERAAGPERGSPGARCGGGCQRRGCQRQRPLCTALAKAQAWAGGNKELPPRAVFRDFWWERPPVGSSPPPFPPPDAVQSRWHWNRPRLSQQSSAAAPMLGAGEGQRRRGQRCRAGRGRERQRAFPPALTELLFKGVK